MRKHLITTVTLAGLLVAVTVLLMLLPRQNYLVLSNILAVLFWILLIADIFYVYLLIKNRRSNNR